MDKAIRLAIEKGGYRYIKQHICKGSSWTGGVVPDYDKTILDPLFWQALGKALGMLDWVEDSHYPIDDFRKDCSKCWAMKYFDLLLTGGDTEKFWKELLNQ